MTEELRHKLITQALDDAQFHGNRVGGDINETYEERIKYIDSVTYLTEEEKVGAKRRLTERKDYTNFIRLKGPVYPCEKCGRSGYTMLDCEHCLRDCLKREFPNWTSGSSIIDDAIRESQVALPLPRFIVEWIPHEDLVNIKYMKKGGFADIYTADWVKGRIISFDKDTQIFHRLGAYEVILKRLNKSGSSDPKFLRELQSHIQCWSRGVSVADCLGVSRDPDTMDFILVLLKQEEDLRNFAFRNAKGVVWRDLCNLFWSISSRLYELHSGGLVHCDLHSGNILRNVDGRWFLSDLGLHRPPNQPENSVYGNLPFMAPEILTGKQYTFAADIYSFAMIMYEVFTGRPPFHRRKHDAHLQLKIIGGKRPKLPKAIPENYRKLMVECWDAIPECRPTAEELFNFFYDECNLCSSDESYGAQLIRGSIENAPMIPPASQSSLYTILSDRKPKNAISDKFFADFDSHHSSLAVTNSLGELTLENEASGDSNFQ